MMNSTGGKGSALRPSSIDQETYASNWERIFGKKSRPVTESTEQSDSGACVGFGQPGQTAQFVACAHCDEAVDQALGLKILTVRLEEKTYNALEQQALECGLNLQGHVKRTLEAHLSPSEEVLDHALGTQPVTLHLEKALCVQLERHAQTFGINFTGLVSRLLKTALNDFQKQQPREFDDAGS